jgi:hypothetical protein
MRQFFENGSSDAWVVRAARTVSAVATENAVAATQLLTDGGAFQVVRATAGHRASDPSFSGNNRLIDIDYDTLRPATQCSALDVVNEGSRLVQLDWTSLAGFSELPQRPAANGTLGGDLTGTTSGTATTLTLSVNIVGRPPANAETPTITKPANAPWIEVRSVLGAAIRNAARGATVAAADRDILARVSVKLIGNGGMRPFRLHVVVVPGRFCVGFDPATRFVFHGVAAGAGVDGLRLANAQATIADAFWRLGGAGRTGPCPCPMPRRLEGAGWYRCTPVQCRSPRPSVDRPAERRAERARREPAAQLPRLWHGDGGSRTLGSGPFNLLVSTRAGVVLGRAEVRSCPSLSCSLLPRCGVSALTVRARAASRGWMTAASSAASSSSSRLACAGAMRRLAVAPTRPSTTASSA